MSCPSPRGAGTALLGHATAVTQRSTVEGAACLSGPPLLLLLRVGRLNLLQHGVVVEVALPARQTTRFIGGIDSIMT